MERLRDGDRFWYEAVFSGQQLADLENTTLADIIRRNTQISGISDNVFIVPQFRRGDCNEDGIYDIADAIRIISYLFMNESAPLFCEKACDANDDGFTDVSDAIWTIQYMFLNGSEPPAPFTSCGFDPTVDALGCYLAPGCP